MEFCYERDLNQICKTGSLKSDDVELYLEMQSSSVVVVGPCF